MVSGSAVAFENVAVVPMDSERLMEHQTVLVEGGRITWVKPANEATVPANAQRIDGRGKYLSPGLADMHGHPLTEQDLRLYVAHGITTVRNMSGTPRHLSWRQRIARGELLGPRIYTAGPILDGPGRRMAWKTTIVTAGDAVKTVGLIQQAGYDALKIYDELQKDTYGYLMEAAAEHGLSVDGHVPFSVGVRGALRAGQRCSEHLLGYPEALLPADQRPANAIEGRAMLLGSDPSFVDERIQELAEATREHGMWNCPTLAADFSPDGIAMPILTRMTYGLRCHGSRPMRSPPISRSLTAFNGASRGPYAQSCLAGRCRS